MIISMRNTRKSLLALILFGYSASSLTSYKTSIHQAYKLKQKQNKSSVHNINNLLMTAARNNDWEEAERLITMKADPNTREIAFNSGRTPLTTAISAGHLRIVKLLLDNQADPDKHDGESNSPLCLASAKNHENIVQLLITKLADPNLPDGHGITALEYATQSQNASMVTLLINNRVNVHAKTRDGKSLLSLACISGNIPIASSLLNARASVDINRIDSYKKSPLIYAAENNYYDLTKLLITSGALAHICNGRIPHLSDRMYTLLREKSCTQCCLDLEEQEHKEREETRNSSQTAPKTTRNTLDFSAIISMCVLQ